MQVADAPNDSGNEFQDADHHDEVIWLQPRSESRSRKRRRAEPARSRSSRPSHATRWTASLGVGALMTLSNFGTALAPSTPAYASVGTGRTDIQQMMAEASLDQADPTLRLALAATGPEVRVQPAEDRATEEAAPAVASDPNEILRFGAMRVPRHIVETILRAAEVTGVDPVYMMALADKESSFSPNARARTSTAEGLFQFLNKTWLEMIRDHGAAHGLAAEAASVQMANGELTIADPAQRERVLGLRRDPYISALMAGEMMKRDRKRIEQRIGRNLTRNEHYLSHFFGAGAAGKFIALRDDKPKQRAAGAFPQAARANRSLFFAREGRRNRGLTVAEVHERIDQMIERRTSRYAAISEVIASAFAPVQ